MRRTRALMVVLLAVTGMLCRPIRAFTQMPVFPPASAPSPGNVAVLKGVNFLVGNDIDVNRMLQTAVRDSREHPEALYDAWRVAHDYPSTASAALKAGNQPFVTLALVQAASDPAQRRDLIAAATDQAAASTDLDLLAEALLAATNKYGGLPALTVFAFGDIRGAVTGPDPKPGVGTGALGLTIRNSWAIWQALLKVAATTDTLKSASERTRSVWRQSTASRSGGSMETSAVQPTFARERWARARRSFPGSKQEPSSGSAGSSERCRPIISLRAR